MVMILTMNNLPVSNFPDEVQVCGADVKPLLGTHASVSDCLGLSLLWIQLPINMHVRPKLLGSCYSHGRPGLSFSLFQPYPSSGHSGQVGVKQQREPSMSSDHPKPFDETKGKEQIKVSFGGARNVVEWTLVSHSRVLV